VKHEAYEVVFALCSLFGHTIMGDYAYLVLARNAAFMVISAGKTDKNRELFIQIICDCYS